MPPSCPSRSCRKVPARLRKQILEECGHRCACDPLRHLGVLVGQHCLEVHHIEPYRFARRHVPGNLVALCPNCHTRADAGEISRWTLSQLKRVVQLRRLAEPSRRERLSALITAYSSVGSKVLGESYFSAAVFFDECLGARLWDARELLAALSELCPSSQIEAELLLARMCLEVGWVARSFQALKCCDANTRRSPYYAFLRGIAHNRNGKFGQAVQWFRRAQEQGLKGSKLHNNLGDTLIHLAGEKKRKSTRDKYFRQALAALNRAGPRDVSAVFNKGRLMMEWGRRDEAEAILEKACELGPQFPLPYVMLGHISADKGDNEAAQRRFEQAVLCRPRHLRFLMRAADVALKAGDPARALRFITAYEVHSGYLDGEELRRVSRMKTSFRKAARASQR